MAVKTYIAAFDTRNEAEQAVADLEARGFSPKDISIISQDTREVHGVNPGTTVAEGALSGAATGGVIGGLAGLLAGAGVVPALAGLLIGGPIAAALGATGVAAAVISGAVTGAAAGTLVGALVNLGVPEADAQYYNERVTSGGYIIAVPMQDPSGASVKEILAAHGAQRLNEVEV